MVKYKISIQKINPPKETSVKQYVNEEGLTVIELNCTICGYCPCKHIELEFSGVKIKALQKIPKDKKSGQK